MQNEAMNYLNQKQCSVPQVIVNLSGENISIIQSPQGNQYYLRVLTYLEGQFYAEADSQTHNENLWRSLGDSIGNIDKHLVSFQHPASNRFLDWDLAHGFGVCQSKKRLLKGELTPLVEGFLGAVFFLPLKEPGLTGLSLINESKISLVFFSSKSS